jgi:hypothetical protein
MAMSSFLLIGVLMACSSVGTRAYQTMEPADTVAA